MSAMSPVLMSARDVLAMNIQPTLHAQRWSLAAPDGAPLGRFVHLASGRGSLVHTRGEMTLHALDLVWLPAGQAVALRVAPGSEGIVVGVSDSLLAAAIGSHAEAHLLRHLTGRTARLTVHETDPRDEILRSLRAIESEARKGLEGSWGYLSAHLTIVLVWMWRLGSQGTLPVEAMAAGTQRLQRFRQLVEAQFRDHWPIARYAAALNTSTDRLHDLCVRSVGRPPLTLLHQRIVLEAGRLLSSTDLGVEAVAAELGFGSASHFSRFFRRWTETSPKAWREQARGRARGGLQTLPASYADWP
jgi:AraC-like DNA-binding protein